ncbi:MAG: glycosyltransferase [Bacillus sp. (in: Bacteria)]|nr:glycosyltransferase [Bacillus sp. (in: firmicutes)]MCM1426138.1 glycosyltransferase [Eubacterium sp.]
MKKVSLLLTTYNSAQNLPITLDSIRSQTYENIEVVIVDGVSTDATISLIERFARDSALEVKWISEPDKGLYDAMNKAYRMCTGDIIAVCNDRLCEKNAVSLLVNAIIEAGEGCIGAHSDLIYVDGDKVIRTWHMGQGNIRQGWMPGHPTLFLKREIYEKYGEYDITYRCAADYEFMVRFLKDEQNKLVYVPKVLISMFYGGTSNAGLQNYLVSFKEGYMALRTNGVKYPLIITLKRTWRVLRQF